MTVNPDVESIIDFSEGLVGCGNWRHFVLLTSEDKDIPVGVLQCVDEPGVALMVTDPKLVMPTYDVTLSDEDLAALQLTRGSKPVVYCTLTLGSDGELTANLLGPLAINAQTRKARQIVLADGSYSARHPVGALEG